MDRFTWAFAAGGLAICVVAIASVFIVRAAGPPPLSTPAGVVTAYVQAVRDRDADRAWGLLGPAAAVGSVPPPPGSNTTTRDAFRRQVAGLPENGTTSSRIRIAETTINGDSARVAVEITTTTGGPALFGGEYSRSLTFGLKRVNGDWRIDTAPAPYEIG